jgi:hypothetical protein
VRCIYWALWTVLPYPWSASRSPRRLQGLCALALCAREPVLRCQSRRVILRQRPLLSRHHAPAAPRPPQCGPRPAIIALPSTPGRTRLAPTPLLTYPRQFQHMWQRLSPPRALLLVVRVEHRRQRSDSGHSCFLGSFIPSIQLRLFGSGSSRLSSLIASFCVFRRSERYFGIVVLFLLM